MNDEKDSSFGITLGAFAFDGSLRLTVQESIDSLNRGMELEEEMVAKYEEYEKRARWTMNPKLKRQHSLTRDVYREILDRFTEVDSEDYATVIDEVMEDSGIRARGDSQERGSYTMEHKAVKHDEKAYKEMAKERKKSKRKSTKWIYQTDLYLKSTPPTEKEVDEQIAHWDEAIRLLQDNKNRNKRREQYGITFMYGKPVRTVQLYKQKKKKEAK